jgi:hypothetical protein
MFPITIESGRADQISSSELFLTGRPALRRFPDGLVGGARLQFRMAGPRSVSLSCSLAFVIACQPFETPLFSLR